MKAEPHSIKELGKVEEILKRMMAGLQNNPSLQMADMLIFIHATLTQYSHLATGT